MKVSKEQIIVECEHCVDNKITKDDYESSLREVEDLKLMLEIKEREIKVLRDMYDNASMGAKTSYRAVQALLDHVDSLQDKICELESK